MVVKDGSCQLEPLSHNLGLYYPPKIDRPRANAPELPTNMKRTFFFGVLTADAGLVRRRKR